MLKPAVYSTGELCKDVRLSKLVWLDAYEDVRG